MTLLSRADLETYADVHYDDNTTGEIVEEEVRTGYKNMADSAVIKNEAGDIGAGLEWNANLIRIKAAGVTLAMMENRAQATFIGRKAAAGTGAPQEMSASEAKTILAIAATDVSGLSAFATSTDLVNATGTLAIARIADGTVTLAKQANLAQATVVGRASGAGTGVPTALVAADLSTILGLATIATSGSASDLGTGTLPIARIAAGAIVLAKLEDRAQATFIGRKAAAGTGVPQEMSASEAKTILAITTSDITGLAAIATSGSASDLGTGTLPIARIADGAVTLAKLENRTQATFIGRKAAAGTGAPQEMTGTEAKTILAIVPGDVTGLAAIASSGSASDLGTGTLPIARIADGAVTLAKLENRTQGTFIGRKAAAGTGVPQEMTAAEAKTILAISTSDITGLSAFATSTDLVNATGTLAIARIADGTVTLAKIANGTGLSVIGRSANSAGVNADIVGTDGQVLRVSGTALGFGTIVAAGIASDAVTTVKILDAAVTLAKLQNILASTIIGRASGAGTGVPTALGASQVKTILAIDAATDITGLAAIATSGSGADLTTATVTLAKMANLAQSTIIGRAAAAGTGVPTALTAGQVSTILGLATIATSGSASDLGTGTVPDARISGSYTNLAGLTLSGNITLSTSPAVIAQAANVLTIRFTTADAADTGVASLAGGGGLTAARGAYIRLYGNEASGSPGSCELTPGEAAYVNLNGPWAGGNNQTQDATYSFALADAGGQVRHTSAGAHTWTIPANATVAFPIMTIIYLGNTGSGAVTIGRAAGVTLVGGGAGDGNGTLTQNRFGAIMKYGTNAWANLSF